MNNKKELKLHPIQLKGIILKELSIQIKDPGKASKYKSVDSTITTGFSDFNEEKNIIIVGVKCEIGSDKKSVEKSAPYRIHVEIMGEFKVNLNEFPKEKLKDWAVSNAPYILFPYLREQIYSLSLRADIPPILLPLFEVPTMTIKKS